MSNQQPNSSWLNTPAGPAPQAPETSSRFQREPENPNIYKLKITEDNREAGVSGRLLPRGVDGIVDNIYPSVFVLRHRLQDEGTKNYRTVACRKTLGQDVECPICKSVWDHWRAAKESGRLADAKEYLKMLGKEEWYTNFLIRDDEKTPANNGRVVILKTSALLKEILYRPLEGNKRKKEIEPEQRSKFMKDRNTTEDTRRFTPYCHLNGVDVNIVGQWDDETKRPSYGSTYYAAESTPLAYTTTINPDGTATYTPDFQKMEAIIGQCHDLQQIITEAKIPTEQEALTIVTKFWEAVDRKRSNQALNQSTPATSAHTKPATDTIDSSAYFGQQPQQYRAPIQQPQQYQAPIQQPVYQQPTQQQYQAPIQPPAQPQYQSPIQQPVQQQYQAPIQQPVQQQYQAPIQQPAQQQYQAPIQQPAQQQQQYQAPTDLPPIGDDDDELPF